MAFDKSNLEIGASSKGVQGVNRYISSTDAVATIEGADYFTYDEVGGVMKDEDLIYYVGSNGGKLAAISNSGSAITLKAVTLFT